MEYARQFVFGSQPLRLSPRQWLVTGLALATLVVGLPSVGERAEPFAPGPDYRLPYEFSNDYRFCRRWIATAARQYPCLVLGDSVAWGEYVAPDQTLAAQLNRLSGQPTFANLGVNGLHPAAMCGLVRYHATALHDRAVVVVFNPLWLSSPKFDLRTRPDPDADAGLNHPGLLPQFVPRLAGYAAPFEARVGNLLERHLPLLGWITHLRAKSTWYQAHDPAAAAGLARPENAEPLLDMPRERPFLALFRPVPAPDPAAHGDPVPWTSRGLSAGPIPWPRAAQSPQAQAFRDTLAQLRRRGNRPLVWVAPFNPGLLTPDSRAAYEALVQDLLAWCTADGVPTVCGTPPPSEEYADASHPLAAGYVRLAEELHANPAFRTWYDTRR